MVDTGVFESEDRVELIEGVIVDMMSPSGWSHLSVLHAVAKAFGSLEAAEVCVQYTLQVNDETVVDPDLMLLPRDHRIADGIFANDVLLLVEVADTSLPFDRGPKAERYAAAGIPDYWIVDVAAKQILVLRDPTERGYASIHTITAGEVRALNVPVAKVTVSELFPS